jgi:lipopolysaccharide/colanic/teichoic acid biosynthesis glycosyltransferase
VFLIVGLYDRHIALFEHTLPTTILEAQVVNMALAVLYFFLAPIAIQPKTILVLYFVISTALIVVWRLGVFRLRSVGQGEPALFVGSGPEMDALVTEVRNSPHTNLEFADYVPTLPEDTQGLQVVLDPRLGRSTDTLDASELYEALFGRVALTMLDRERFLARAQSRESRLYDILKRALDIVLASMLGVLSLVVYPFVCLAIYLEDRGTLFVSQTRVGKDAHEFTMMKFRSMSANDSGAYGADGKSTLKVTRVGNVLRKSRIDELPQLWSILVGGQSLIGPRPELPPLVQVYGKEIQNYDLRHLVKPGLSGWAQIYHDAHPHHGTDIDATKDKLSYDLYYIKHRSFALDLMIALKTIRTLLTLAGR